MRSESRGSSAPEQAVASARAPKLCVHGAGARTSAAKALIKLACTWLAAAGARGAHNRDHLGVA
eukprot:3147946-Prymnesium_polylepis.1